MEPPAGQPKKFKFFLRRNGRDSEMMLNLIDAMNIMFNDCIVHPLGLSRSKLFFDVELNSLRPELANPVLHRWKQLLIGLPIIGAVAQHGWF